MEMEIIMDSWKESSEQKLKAFLTAPANVGGPRFYLYCPFSHSSTDTLLPIAGAMFTNGNDGC